MTARVFHLDVRCTAGGSFLAVGNNGTGLFGQMNMRLQKNQVKPREPFQARDSSVSGISAPSERAYSL